MSTRASVVRRLCIVFIFVVFYAFFTLVEATMGNRVSPVPSRAGGAAHVVLEPLTNKT